MSQNDRLVNTVMMSYNTIMEKLTETSQRKKKPSVHLPLKIRMVDMIATSKDRKNKPTGKKTMRKLAFKM